MRLVASLSTVLALCLGVPAVAAAGPAAAIGAAVNRARAQHGLRGLQPSRQLARAAGAHSGSMLRSGALTHGHFAARLRRYVHARTIGETLAVTPRCSARRVVRMWLHSPPHRAVLLSRRMHRVGIGVRRGRRACMVTADFAS